MSDINKKPEKLASAVYLITSFFSDQEPLKWKLRDLASELASLGVFIKDNFYREGDRIFLETRNIILEMSTLISMAKTAGLVSDANHSILEMEISKYLESLELPKGLSEFGGRAILSSNFFSLNSGNDSDGQKNTEPKVEEDKNNDSLNLRDTPTESKNLPEHRKVSDSTSVPQKIILDKGHLPAVVGSNLKDYGVVSAKKGNRQSVIIGLLKRKKEIMIKDVSPLIKGCSEKTIQRELSAMVQSGLLKKEGEKRWSKYSLA